MTLIKYIPKKELKEIPLRKIGMQGFFIFYYTVAPFFVGVMFVQTKNPAWTIFLYIMIFIHFKMLYDSYDKRN